MRYLLMFALTLSLSIPAMALEVPVSQKGALITHPGFAGAKTCVIDNSTGTAALQCADGSGVVVEVIGSSVAATDYLTFRDTDTANTSSAELLRVSQGNLSGVKVYPHFQNGLSVNASVAPSPASGAWTVIYVPK